MPNAPSHGSGLDQAIDLLNALNRSTRGRGTVRLDLPKGALEHAPPTENDGVRHDFSFDYATHAEAEHARNVIQSVYSAHAESQASPVRLEAALYGATLVVWITAFSELELADVVAALTRRLHAFE